MWKSSSFQNASSSLNVSSDIDKPQFTNKKGYLS